MKTKASFQKGLIPIGKLDLRVPVTAQMSIIVKTIERTIASIMIPKRGEMYISSKRPKS